jgi:Leucine-rich repeat (LRR) protein
VPAEIWDPDEGENGGETAWWQVEALTALKLGRNALYELPVGLRALVDLQLLDVSSNSLTSYPDELGALASLKNLDLSSNQCVAVACCPCCMSP